jgi:large repetitive protein
MYLKVLLLQMLAFFYALSFSAQTLIINEVSQGESGNMEFIEFVVVDTAAVYDCGDTSPPTIDIRGWIIDDNNGYHSPANEGIAGGAVRFSNDAFWSAVPLGTIILVYNQGDISPSIPADDISLSDGNCHIVVPVNNTSLFESNSTTPGDVACSYPGGVWTAGGTWNNIVLRNGGDCARILDLAGCEVFSVCWGDNSQNTQIYFSGSASNTVYYFNDTDPTSQVNWSSGCSDNETVLDATTCGSNDQTPGSPNNALNEAYIAQFNNGCMPITPIVTTAASTDASCGLCDGTATGSSSGSIPGYTYAWYDASYNSIGQNTAAATALCPGTYHVISSSSISCADTATVIISTTGAPLAPIAGSDAIYCFGDALTDLTANGSGGLLTWYDDIGLSNFLGTGGVYSPSNTIGSTIYYVTETIAGCEGPPSLVTVTVNPLPTATLTGGGTYCRGTAIPDMTVTLTGTAPWSITYTDGVTPVTVPGIMTSPYTISGVADGTYVVSAVSDVSCIGTFSGNASITVISLPTAILTGGGTICSGDPIPDMTVTLTGTAPWSVTYTDGVTPVTVPGIMTSPYTISGAADGTYVLSAVSDANCIGTFSDSADIITNPLPTATLTGGGTICSGDPIPDMTVTLTGTAPWSITYTDGVTPVTVPGIMTSPYTISGAADGTYVLSAVSDANCTGTFSGSADIITNPLPMAILTGGGTICSGDPIPDMTVTLTGTAPWSITYTDGVTPVTVSGIMTSPYTISGAADGTYVLSAVSDANCTGTFSGSADIITTPLPLAPTTSADVSYCDGDALADLTASGSGGSLTWYSDASLTTIIGTGGATTPTNTIGVTIYYVTETTPGGCEGPAGTVVVTVNSLPIIDSEIAADATICGGADGTITITASGGSGIYSYSIDGGATFPNTNGVFTGLAVNSYQVVIDDGNCQTIGSIFFVSAPSTPPAPTAGVSAIYCEGDVISDLTAAASMGGTLTWYDDAGLTNVVGTGVTFSPNTTAGNYTYYVTEVASGCEGSSSQITVDINAVPTATVTGGGTICFGEPIPDVVITLTGSSPWSITYTDGVTPVTVSPGTSPYTLVNSVDGTYEVTSVSDVTGCVGTFSGVANVITNPDLTGSVTGGGTICFGDPIPGVTITLAGTSPWDLTYTDGVTPVTINTATSPYVISGGGDGVYSITSLTDASGCPSIISGSATILTNPLPTAIISGGGVICSGLPIPDISIALTGTGPWSITYFDGSTPTTISTNLNPYVISNGMDGTYTVTNVSDVNCTGTSSGSATILSNPLPLAPTAGVDATYCIGDPIIDLFATGGGGVLTWYSDMGITIEGTGTAFSPINSVGVFTYYVSEEMNGCTGPLSLVNITINDVPTIDSEVAVDVTGCNITDGSITIVASGGLPPYSYSIDGGTTFTNTTGAFTGLDVNSYQVVVADANCQTVGSLLVITGPGIPSAPSAGTDAAYCDGDVVSDLTATPGSGGSISWYDDAALTNLIGTGVSYSPTTVVGNYTYYVTETVSGCESPSSQLTIDINPTPLAPILLGGATYCEGDPIADLQASPGGVNSGTFYWFDDVGLTNNTNTGPVYSPPTTIGSYTYYIVDSLNGCVGPSASVNVIINSLPSFTIATSDPTICGGTNGFITIEGLNSNTTYDVQYSIDGNAQPLVSLTSDINGDILISNLTQGTYSDFTLTINGCSYTDLGPYVLSDPSVPVFNVGNPIDPSGCGTVDGTITISGLTANTTYNLTYNLNGSPVGPNSITTDINGDFIITGLSDGVYDNFAVDLNGCVGSSAVMITLFSIIPLAPNALGDSTYCEGEVMVDLSVLPAVGGEINWYADNLLTNQVAVNTTTFTPPTAPGIYTYWITETLNGCEGDTTSVTVEVVALPLSPLAGNDTSYCESQSIIDITATAQGVGTLAWYSDADLTNLIGTGSSLSPFATVGSIVYYIVEVNGNCIGTYDSIVVNIDPAPVADFTATPTTGTSPLLVDFTDNSTGAGISYSWDFGNGITYFEQDTMNTYYNSGSFTSSLTVSDTNGCTDSYSLIITIENPPVPVDSSHIIVPNIFTPNGDYENDFFKLNTNNILELEGTIFNRWGQVVFIINTIEGGWDGRTVAGIECPEGTYYYLIHALGGDGVEYNFQGPFELIR